MKAGAVIPRKKGSAHVVEMPMPETSGDELLVRILRVTLDGTDAEINQGVYGEAPPGEKYLVIGHEALGRIESSSKSEYLAGELVTPLVRLPGGCSNCRNGRSDLCLDGNFRECGIKGAHGYLREWAAVSPDFLVKVPGELKEVATLAEPLSISVKGLEQALEFQSFRLNPINCVLILGAGSLGMLAAALVRSRDFDVYIGDVVSRSSLKAQLVKTIGAKYFNIQEAPLHEVRKKAGSFDLIIETTGNSEQVFEAWRNLGANGVLCLMGIAAGVRMLSIDANAISTQLVMENRLVFGTVSSNRDHFVRALETLKEIERRWPGWLDSLITDRLSIEDFAKAFDPVPEKVKTAIEIW